MLKHLTALIYLKTISAEPILKKVLVPNGRHRGKCLDGSAPGYYKKIFDPETAIENKVLIYKVF